MCVVHVAYRPRNLTQIGQGEGEGGVEGEADIDVIITITCYILPICCLLIALDAHMLSHNGYGPGHRDPKRRSSRSCGSAHFGPWARTRAHIHYG